MPLFCSGKAVSITFYEPVYEVVIIRHEKRMRQTVSPFVACPTLHQFTALSQPSEEKIIEYKIMF